MQPARSRAKDDVPPRRVVFELRGAVPQAGPAVDALFAVEDRDAAGAGRDGLAGAGFDAQLGLAALAEMGVLEPHVVGESRRGLHLAADQQRVLVRDQQLAIVGNGRPAATLHEGAVAGNASRAAARDNLPEFVRGDLPAVILFQIRERLRLAGDPALASGEARQRHAQQARNHALVESVARLLGDAAFFLDPACAPPSG